MRHHRTVQSCARYAVLMGAVMLTPLGCSSTSSDQSMVDGSPSIEDGSLGGSDAGEVQMTMPDGGFTGDAERIDASQSGRDQGASDVADMAIRPARYTPDDGPNAEQGRVVRVGTEQETLDAIAGATPGDVITLAPGEYGFDRLIVVDRDGRADAPIFLRAEMAGTVTLNLSHIENFKIYGKHWVFNCVSPDNVRAGGCEHAFHLVGDADDLLFRTNEVLNFASHVKLNGEVIDGGTARHFPDRAQFIRNVWHNTRYIPNNAPHNILNLDGGRNHVVRGNIFVDFTPPADLRKSASAVYPKASAKEILIEQNLIICERLRTEGETARGIQLGDGAGPAICDGDDDGDGLGDCVENGQSQNALVRNNIILNCDNGGSSTGIMVADDRDSLVAHNTVLNTGRRKGGFFVGREDHTTRWRGNLLENGIDVAFAVGTLDESDNDFPSADDVAMLFQNVQAGEFSVLNGAAFLEAGPTHSDVHQDFCGYPRGERADRGAIEYSTTYPDADCVGQLRALFDRLP